MAAVKIIERRNRVKKPDGFTLIEVIVSIAIVSVVVAAVMQMFAVSAKTNSKAYMMDKANALSVETAERFKADPNFAAAAGSGFSPAPAVSGVIYSQYLDRNFGSAATAPESSSVYRLDVMITTSPAAITTAFYYPDPAFSYELKSDDIDHFSGPDGPEYKTTLYLQPDGSECKAWIANNAKLPVDTGKIILSDGTKVTAPTAFNFTEGTADGAAVTSGTALIPILIDCKALQAVLPVVDGEKKLNIDVENKAGTVINAADGSKYTAVADVYLCNVPEGITVTVNATKGGTADHERPVSTDTGSENVMYTAEISIVKISDNSVIIKNMAEKYWVK